MQMVLQGANRGIGLSLTKQYINENHTVIAVCRTTSTELDKTGAQIISNIDIKDVNMENVTSSFIGATHAAGTIQRLVWQQMDFEAKQKQAMQTTKAEKTVKKP